VHARPASRVAWRPEIPFFTAGRPGCSPRLAQKEAAPRRSAHFENGSPSEEKTRNCPTERWPGQGGVLVVVLVVVVVLLMPLLVSEAAADPHRAFPFSCSKLDRHSTRGNSRESERERERERENERGVEGGREKYDRQSEEEAPVASRGVRKKERGREGERSGSRSTESRL